MSEVKTTKEIRELFTDGGFFSSKEFDRWLEQHDAEVAKATEERIRKVLQAEADHASNEEYKRAFTQFLADLPYTAEELFGEGENK